jgi:LysM repeat protein
MAAGCTDGDDAGGADASASSLAAGSTDPAAAGVETYRIEAGDAVSAIADRHCVTAAAVAEANGWSDGVDHLIQPGDAIIIPADACETAAPSDDDDVATRPATTRAANSAATITTASVASGPTTTVNQYIESYRFDGGVAGTPMLGDLGQVSEGDDPCSAAYTALVEFNQGTAGVAELEAALTAVGVTPTADQLRNIQDWQEWKDTYLDGYQAVLDEITAAGLSDAATIEPLLAEPAYVEAMDAAAAIEGPAEGAFSSVVNACS